MSKNVSLHSAVHHRQIVENLFQYYVYDLSEFTYSPCNNDGIYSFKSSSLEPYWSCNDHWPYLVYCGDELAGFCLVRRYPYDLQRYDIDQFFIIRKFRGMGVAKEAFRHAVSGRPGLWQTRVMLENISALRFWRSAVNSVSKGKYQEKILADYDLNMYFLMYEII